MLIVNKTMNEVGFVIDNYNGFTDLKEEELAKLLKSLKVKKLKTKIKKNQTNKKFEKKSKNKN